MLLTERGFRGARALGTARGWATCLGNPLSHSRGAEQLFVSDFGRDPEISTVYLKPPSHLGILGGKALFFIPTIGSGKLIYSKADCNDQL